MLFFLRTAFCLLSSKQVPTPMASLGAGLAGMARESCHGQWLPPGRGRAGNENVRDRHVQRLMQSATSHLLCGMQANYSCLGAQLLCLEKGIFTWSIVCLGTGQTHHC